MPLLASKGIQYTIMLIHQICNEVNFDTGTRFSECWNQNPAENVAAEHEDQTHCVGDSGSLDPHHSPLCLPWLQLREVSGAPSADLGVRRNALAFVVEEQK